MFYQLFSLVYRLLRENGWRRVDLVERYLDFDESIGMSIDDKRNEPITYATIFSEEYRSEIERFLKHLLKQMKNTPFDQCDELFEALIFIQVISSKALWQYHQNVGEKIERFVRDFDRLDVLSERVRLFEDTQKGY